MNIQKITLVIVLSVITAGSAFSQNKIGVFVHGFNGGSEKWLEESKAPQNWKSAGIIDDFIALDYETMELATTSSQTALLNKFISEMDDILGSPSDDINVTLNNRANNEWIIVGHSLGGIVGRVLYPKFRLAGFNVVAVVSVGGPSQGAAATNVSKSTITSSVSRIKDKIIAAQEHVAPTVSFLLKWEAVFASFKGNISASEQIASIPDYLDVARDKALGYADTVIVSGAKDLIGLDGEIIQTINSFDKANVNLHPQNYISIIGAEKDKAPIRMIGHIFEEEEYKDEVKTIDEFQNLRNQYFSKNEGYYRQLADRYHWCRTFRSCRDSRDYAHYRENLWKLAKLEIDELGTTWSTIINSYRIATIEVLEYIPPCENGVGPIRIPIMLDIGILPNGEECSTDQNGEYAYRPKEIQVGDKNDGVVNIHSALWSKGDSFVGAHNQYFDDTPADGGYNHFELRNHKRAYTLPGYFTIGDKTPSMERVEVWISNGFDF